MSLQSRPAGSVNDPPAVSRDDAVGIKVFATHLVPHSFSARPSFSLQCEQQSQELYPMQRVLN